VIVLWCGFKGVVLGCGGRFVFVSFLCVVVVVGNPVCTTSSWGLWGWLGFWFWVFVGLVLVVTSREVEIQWASIE
jgi:hypothetical protein